MTYYFHKLPAEFMPESGRNQKKGPKIKEYSGLMNDRENKQQYSRLMLNGYTTTTRNLNFYVNYLTIV